MIAFATACSAPWAILPSALEQILELSQRERLSGDELAAKLEAVAAKLGRPLDNTRKVTMREGGVAVIPISGPIARHMSLFHEISGGTSTEMLATDIQAALSNPNVSAIVLEIDSPGGESAGVGELASHIYAASMQKPVIAYVSSLGASAAYWLASAAGEVVVSPSAILGSIGTVMVHHDTTARDERSGVKKLEIVSSQSPNKRPDMKTEDGRSQVQSMVDALTDVFVADVAMYRDCSIENVLADFGQGGVKVGQAAIDAGMADRLGTLEGVIAELAADPVGSSRTLVRSKTESEPKPKGKLVAKSWKDMFASWTAAGQPDNFDPINAVETAVVKTLSIDQKPPTTTSPPTESVVSNAAIDELKAELAQLKKDTASQVKLRIESEAKAFVLSEVRASRMFPAEAVTANALYVQAAMDDLASPLASGSRLASLKAQQSARPPHNLTRDTVGNADLPDDLTVLSNGPAKHGEVTPESVKRLLATTDQGRGLLALNNGGLPVSTI